ncbi:hypothetical protein M5689_010537 [Euphorbia peplus]|nr:hypothetical protein M5689_010537 [Euphorbia peplus]
MASLLPLPISILLFSLIFFCKIHLYLALADQSDIHDVIPDYGLPAGLIPGNVKSYTISDSGAFSIELNTPCYVHFDLLVYYDTQIKGKLSYGAVRDVSGIQAKKAFLWLPVTGIEASQADSTIQFFVGPFSKQFPASRFRDIPACESKVSIRTLNLDSI